MTDGRNTTSGERLDRRLAVAMSGALYDALTSRVGEIARERDTEMTVSAFVRKAIREKIRARTS